MTTGRGRAGVAPRQLPVTRPGGVHDRMAVGSIGYSGRRPRGTRVWRAVRVRGTADRPARAIGGRCGPAPSRGRSNPRRPPPVDRHLPVVAHRRGQNSRPLPRACIPPAEEPDRDGLQSIQLVPVGPWRGWPARALDRRCDATRPSGARWTCAEQPRTIDEFPATHLRSRTLAVRENCGMRDYVTQNEKKVVSCQCPRPAG